MWVQGGASADLNSPRLPCERRSGRPVHKPELLPSLESQPPGCPVSVSPLQVFPRYRKLNKREGMPCSRFDPLPPRLSPGNSKTSAWCSSRKPGSFLSFPLLLTPVQSVCQQIPSSIPSCCYRKSAGASPPLPPLSPRGCHPPLPGLPVSSLHLAARQPGTCFFKAHISRGSHSSAEKPRWLFRVTLPPSSAAERPGACALPEHPGLALPSAGRSPQLLPPGVNLPPHPALPSA